MSNKKAAFGQKMSAMQGNAVWNRADMEQDSSWRFQLNEAAKADIHENLMRMDAEQVILKDLNPEDFPLPSMTAELAEIRASLSTGRGLALISGFEVGDYTQAQAALAFYGIGLHIGVGVSQSHKGDYIGEVMDRRDVNDRRPYHNGGEFIMHRDPVDLVGLLSIRKGKQGGESRIISSAAVHNVLLEEHPELMETLYRGYPYMRTTPDRGETDLYTPYRMPVFKITESGEFMSHYIPGFSEFYQERDGVPKDHIEVTAQTALKETLWHRPELYIDMMMQPGDMQFVNNRLLMHARTDYEDWPEPERFRLLLRLWLQMPELGDIPADQQFFTNTDRAGGGIAKLI
ncbi:MAG: TauD/TfdA family dioxygenase [Pontibacterium sp.]